MRKPSRDQGSPDRFRVDVKAQLALPSGDFLPCTIRECSPTGQSVELHAAYRETDDLQGELAFIEFTLPDARVLSLAVMIDQAAEWRMELSYLSPQTGITDALRSKRPAQPTPVEDQTRRSERPEFSSPQLQQIRREFVTAALQSQRKALSGFAEAVEENLFEAADRAVSNQIQTELMAFFRRRSEDCSGIEQHLIAQLKKLTEALGSAKDGPSPRGQTEPDIESMTLIARDEMDSWVQMTNLAAAAEKRNREPLSHLTTRISALFHTDLDNEANPLSPSVACDIVAEQIRDLALPPAVQRVYWQSFDKTFLKGLSAAYANLNTLLKERGVVPDIVRSYSVRKAETPPDPSAAETTAPTDHADGGLTADRADVPTAGRPADLPVEDRVTEQVLSRQDLQDLFQDLRREKDAAYRQGRLDYVSLLDQISERIGDVAARLAPGDLRSLELSEAVFNGLTTNQGLAPELRKWVLGLEELVTDTILNDESFIISRAHPARQFISDVAEIGAAGPPLDRELIALLPEISALLEMGGDTPQSAFEEALWRIEPLLQRKRDLALRNLEYTVEQCQVEEILDQTKHRIGEILASRIGPVHLPRFLVDLIGFGWRHLLTLILMQKGSDSPEWQQALDLTDQLVEAFSGQAPPDLSQVTMMNRAERLMTENRCLHVVESPAFRKAKEAAYRLEYGRDLQLPVEDLEKIPLQGSELGGELPDRTREPTGQDEEIGAWLAMAKKFPVGSWFKHAPEPEQETTQRLSWIDQGHARFVFVNTVGIKTLDLRHPEFAQSLKDQQLVPVQGQDIAIVDQSISQVLEKLYARVAYQASHDDLTGLVNRKEFERRLQLAVESATSQHASHVLGLMTLHQLDTIRKLCGSEAGNQALREISDLLGSGLNERSTLSRTGVDQFCVLHEQCSRTDAFRLARKRINLVESYRCTCEDVPYSVNLSIGLVTITADTGHARRVLNAAESACTAAQRSGRNAIHVFREGDEAQLSPDLDEAWTVRINQALDQDRLALRAQEIAPLQNGNEQTHYEILLSVLDEQGKPAPPGEFIEAAERLGLMSDVDRWVIRQAFSWMASNQQVIKQIEMFSINLSGQSLSGERLMEYIREQIALHRVPEHKICFEITETAAVANIDDAIEVLAALRSLGCKVSLDDFGSGLSSYRYLKSLPADYLKIDGSLVKEICSLPTDLAMVQSINEIAHFMDKQVVAEYAENRETVEKLREIGVDYAQGWGVGKAVMLTELAQQRTQFTAIPGEGDSTANVGQRPN